MAAQSPTQTEKVEQPEISGFDLVRQEARAEVRDLFAKLGLSADTLAAIGCDPAALNEPDDED